MVDYNSRIDCRNKESRETNENSLMYSKSYGIQICGVDELDNFEDDFDESIFDI